MTPWLNNVKLGDTSKAQELSQTAMSWYYKDNSYSIDISYCK